MSKSFLDNLFIELEPHRTTPTPLEAQMRGDITVLRQSIDILKAKLDEKRGSAGAGCVSLDTRRRRACIAAAKEDLLKSPVSMAALYPLTPGDVVIDADMATLSIRCKNPDGVEHVVELSYGMAPESAQIIVSMLVSKKAPDLDDLRIAKAESVLANHADLRERGHVIAMSGWQLEPSVVRRNVLWTCGQDGIMHDYAFVVKFQPASDEVDNYTLNLSHSYDRPS